MARIKLAGVREFDAAMKKLTAKADLASRAFVTEGGALIAKSAKRQFTTVAVHRESGVRKVMTKGERMGKGWKIERKGGHVEGEKPHVRSGNLSRSIKVHTAKLGYGKWTSATYPSAIYGRRVELGFRATDSIGRSYNQRPYPYMEPGFRKALPELRELRARLWAEAIK